jgi:hypothetical protein
MTALNAALARVMDGFFAAFAWGGPWAQVAALAVVTSVIALVIFRYTSNQRAIGGLKDRIISRLLEIVLYRDELRVVLRAQRALLWDNFRYLAHSLVPLACMVVPMAALLIQADLRLGHRPLHVGERAIVTVRLRPGAEALDWPSLSAPAGVVVETPPVRIPALAEVDWRIRAARAGVWELDFSPGRADATPAAERLVKQIVVGAPGGRVSCRRASGWWQQTLHPGEPALPAGAPVAYVNVSYPAASLSLLGWRMHWVWPYLALALVVGYLLKGPLRVQL